MTQFNPNRGHRNEVLTRYALAYMEQEWLADKLFPPVDVDKRSDVYRIYPESNSNRVFDLRIGSRQAPGLLDREFTEDDFKTQDRGIADEIPIDAINNDDEPSMLEQEGTVADLTGTLMVEREVRCAAAALSPANYATVNKVALLTGQGWNNAAVDPTDSLFSLRPNIRRGPNTKLVAGCSVDTWTIMRKNPKLLTRVSGGATIDKPADVQKQMMAALLEVDEFVVGESYKTVTNPGQSATSVRVWTDGFFIVAVNPRPTKRSLHFGTTFRYRQPFVHTEVDKKPGLDGVQYTSVRYSEVIEVVSVESGILVSNTSGA